MKKLLLVPFLAVLILPLIGSAQSMFICPSDWICFPKTITACPIGYACVRYSDGFRIDTQQGTTTTPTVSKSTQDAETLARVLYEASLATKPTTVMTPICTFANEVAGNPMCTFNTKNRPSLGECVGGSVTYNDNMGSFLCYPAEKNNG